MASEQFCAKIHNDLLCLKFQLMKRQVFSITVCSPKVAGMSYLTSCDCQYLVPKHWLGLFHVPVLVAKICVISVSLHVTRHRYFIHSYRI